MNVPSTTQVSSQATATSGSSKMGKDEFVKLLMAQLSHQDPTAPMDSEAFVAQLAQFAHVELQQSTNAQLESLVMAQAASNQMGAANFVGKDVTFTANKVTLKDGAETSLQGHLAGPATKVTAVIKDAAGKVVRTIQMGAQPEGDLKAPWDGRDDQGVKLPAGDYSVSLTAADVSGKSVAIDSRVKGRVTGVSFQNGYPELLVGTSRIKLGDVVEISDPHS